MKNKVKRATEIIESEGYYFKHDMMPFSLFRGNNVEHDDIKSFVRLNERSKYVGNEIHTSFNVSICKMMGNDDIPIADYRKVAQYLLHMCDIADSLNELEIKIDREDLTLLGLTAHA